METLALFATLLFLTFFSAWQIIAIRKDTSARDYSTILYLTIDSNEECSVGVPEESSYLKRKMDTHIPIALGMELDEPGEDIPYLVVRVIFEEKVLRVYLKPKRVPLTQLAALTHNYLSTGWMPRD